MFIGAGSQLSRTYRLKPAASTVSRYVAGGRNGMVYRPSWSETVSNLASVPIWTTEILTDGTAEF